MKILTSLKRLFCPLFLLILMLSVQAQSSQVQASQNQSSQKFYFFGDSLSDAGVMDNNTSLPKSFNGTVRKPIYTNPDAGDHHVWGFHISKIFNKQQDFGANNCPSALTADKTACQTPKLVDHGSTVSGTLIGNNYAAGGAISKGEGIKFPNYSPPSLEQQVKRFSLQHADDKQLHENVYFIWVGANNFLKPLADFMKNGDVTQLLQGFSHATSEVPVEVKQQIEALHALGTAGDHPSKFVVINLPNLAKTPAFTSLMEENPALALFAGVMNSMSKNFNNNLAQQLNTIPGIELINFDTYGMLNTITDSIDNDAQYIYQTEYLTGIKTITLSDYKTSACKKTGFSLDIGHQSIMCNDFMPNSEELLFADIVHPSAKTHMLQADLLAKELKAHNWLSQ